jgi:hypothetical protein
MMSESKGRVSIDLVRGTLYHTEILAPVVINLPLNALGHIQQVTNQRQFLWTWWEGKAVDRFISAMFEVEENRYNEESAGQKVSSHHERLR